MEQKFWIALCASAALHAAVCAPIYTAHASFTAVSPKTDTVVYYLLPEKAEAKVTATKLPPKTETPRIDIAQPVAATQKATAKPTDERPRKDAAVRQAPLTDAQRQARIRSSREYIDYYQLIREKIRAQLKRQYRAYVAQGEVNLIFVLSADGRLESVGVDSGSSAADRALHEIAMRSVREASPFPAFPKTVDLPRMSFTLQVSFQRE